MEKPDERGMGLERETPVGTPRENGAWGSDAIASMIGDLGIEYLAINPGASFRGLHDSVVNFLGNRDPQFLLCLHEESAVAIAHGYAKVTDRMMGAVLHSNVGLMHGTMAIFNAWCDRQPIFLLGATGPWDASLRRPWIDWIHTVSDQGGMIRDFTKWDNQPASVEAAYEALLRARKIAMTGPKGPVYVNLDMALQEQKLDVFPPKPDATRYLPGPSPVPDAGTLAAAAEMLAGARNPVILAGRVSRSEEAWAQRVALAEKLQARVWTDLKSAAAFPTDHPLHMDAPGTFLATQIPDELKQADVILSLDWNDLSGLLRQIGDAPARNARIIQVSADIHSHRGWSSDHQGLPPVDLTLLCEPCVAVPLLTGAVTQRPPASIAPRPVQAAAAAAGGMLETKDVAAALNGATEGLDIALTRLPLAWKGAFRDFRHPLDFLGYDGGGGVGSGPGITVGAALALKDSARIAVGVLGDGDFLMGVTALWTATHYRLPCVFILCNNRSFFNDEMHQEKMARLRGRPIENRWIGQRIEGPDIDLAMLARAQGAHGIGPVRTWLDLEQALEEAFTRARAGDVVVVDVLVK